MYKKKTCEGDSLVYKVGNDNIRAERKYHAMHTGSLVELFICDLFCIDNMVCCKAATSCSKDFCTLIASFAAAINPFLERVERSGAILAATFALLRLADSLA